MKYWLRDGWEHLSVYLSLKVQNWRHGRIRCVVLGHDHSLPVDAWDVRRFQVPPDFAEALNMGTDITEFIDTADTPTLRARSDTEYDEEHGGFYDGFYWWEDR